MSEGIRALDQFNWNERRRPLYLSPRTLLHFVIAGGWFGLCLCLIGQRDRFDDRRLYQPRPVLAEEGLLLLVLILLENARYVKNGKPTQPPNVFLAKTLERADAELIRACRKGDQSAWDTLVDRYQRLIYAIPRRAGLSDEESADVFQEVFVTLLEKIDEIEQPAKIRSWIVTTSKFKTWGVIRGRKGARSMLDDEDVEDEISRILDSAPLADEVLIELERQHLIRTAIAKLDERCRTIVSMIYLRVRPASYAEVGEAIGTGESSISPLRTRCLKKLEKILTK